jgi:YbbR domain-containing protein
MRDIIAKDFGWKLFSLILACIIWYTIRTVSRGDIQEPRQAGDWLTRPFTNLPVRILTAAGDTREFTLTPESVNVTARGRPEDMTSLVERDIHAVVDVTDIEASQGILRRRVDVSAPPRVTLIRVSPSEVDVAVTTKRKQQE